MTALRPLDVALESLTNLLSRGTTTISATTLCSPSWGYAMPRGDTRCRLPLDERVLDRVTDYVARHRAALAQTGCYLRLVLDESVVSLCVVDVVRSSLLVPGNAAYDLLREARRERTKCQAAA